MFDNIDLVDGIIAAIAPFGMLVLTQIAKWLGNKTKTEIDDKLYAKLLGFAEVVVRSVYQTYVAALKEAGKDGKLTSEEKAAAKRMAMDKLKSYFTIKELFGLAGGQNIDQFVGDIIEGSIDAVRTAAKKGSTTANPFPPKPGNG